MSIPPKVKETSAQLEQLEIFSGVAAEDVLIKPKNHAFHAEQPKTPEELKAERRFVRKIDLWILPLLSVMYFLASLVSTTPTTHRTQLLFNSTSNLGSRRRWLCRIRWLDGGTSH